MCSKEMLNSLLARLYAQLNEIFGTHLRSVILFGSYARNDANEDSDVDVLILLDLPREEIARYRRDVAEITGEFLLTENLLFSPILENESFFERHRQILPFYQNIAREGVRIVA